MKKLKVHPTMKDFYNIKNTHCWINKFGKIWSEKKKEFIIEDAFNYNSKDKEYYPQRVLDDGSIRPLHRLVAEMFVKKPRNDDSLQVNHIDGNKKNYSYTNLEWVTPSENIQHAYKTGLTSINIPVLVKDLENNRIYHFYSISECSKFLKVDPRRVIYYMKKLRKIPFRKKWDIIQEGNPWNPIPKSNVGKEHRNADKAIIGIKKSDKSVVIFANIARAADFTGINKRIIERRLYRERHPTTYTCGPKLSNLDWIFFYYTNIKEASDKVKNILNEEVDLTSIKEIKTNRMNNLKNYKPPAPVEVINEKTGYKSKYRSLRLFCEEKKLNYEIARKLVRIKGFYKEYKIRYLK